MRRCTLRLPELATSFTGTAPSASPARRRMLVLPSWPGFSDSGLGPSPTSVSEAGSSTFRVTVIALPSVPSAVLATPTGSSNSSPGAMCVGTVGVSTKSPRTSALVVSMPMRSVDTATAITRSWPLK